MPESDIRRQCKDSRKYKVDENESDYKPSEVGSSENDYFEDMEIEEEIPMKGNFQEIHELKVGCFKLYVLFNLVLNNL